MYLHRCYRERYAPPISACFWVTRLGRGHRPQLEEQDGPAVPRPDAPWSPPEAAPRLKPGLDLIEYAFPAQSVFLEHLRRLEVAQHRTESVHPTDRAADDTRSHVGALRRRSTQATQTGLQERSWHEHQTRGALGASSLDPGWLTVSGGDDS
jgi:hypothetical protein